MAFSNMNEFPRLSPKFTALSALGAFMVGVMFYGLIRYALAGSYLDHAEPEVVDRAWALLSGHNLYDDVDDVFHSSLIYGPNLFLASAAVMALFGGSIMASKLVVTIAIASSVAIMAAYIWRAYGFAYLGLAMIVFSSILMTASPFSMWVRPDPLLVLMVTLPFAAIAIKPEADSHWILAIFTAICIGLAVNLKIHGFIYFAPFVIRYCSNKWYITWPVMAAVAVLAFLVSFTNSGISLENYYAALTSVTETRKIIVSFLPTIFRYGLIFITPVILAVCILFIRKKQLPWRELVYFATLFAAWGMLVYPASVAGSGWYHFIPLAPVTVDVLCRLSVQLKTHKIALNSLLAIFVVAYVIFPITPQKRIHRNIDNMSWTSDAIAEINKIVSMYPGKTIEMGYGEDFAETYKHTFVRPVLFFAGHRSTISAMSAMERKYKDEIPPFSKVEHIKRCKTDVWLIPKDEKPFAMQNYFKPEPAFWPEYMQTFVNSYEKRRSFDFYDVWQCRDKP